MIDNNLKKILAERETGTAVKSAQMLAWKNSVAFDPNLCIETDPTELYTFNSRLYLEPGFLDTFKQMPAAFLQDLHLITETLPEATLFSQILDRQLSEEEQLALLQVIAVAQKGMSTQEALETVLSSDGYGMPAVVVLVIAVALAVAVWVAVA